MWWKRAFIILLGVNVLVCVAGLLVWNSFPAASPSSARMSVPNTSSTAPAVDVVIGQDAVNAYMNYAIQHETDLRQIIEQAKVQFASNWICDVNVKVLGRSIPFHLVMTPIIQSGNLLLRVQNASMGDVSIPNVFLFSVLSRAHWPNWIRTDSAHDTLQINLTQRPQKPFGVSAVRYSDVTQQLTMKLQIAPHTLLK